MFDQSLAKLLVHEGGFVNHPSDPGGITNLGVTKATWEAWTGKPASIADMKALTPSKVAPLYKARYWDAVKADSLPAPLAHCVFDFAVNSGPARAARFLQTLVGADVDGKIGPGTMAAVKAYVVKHGAVEAARGYQKLRENFYRKQPTFKVFGKGWLNRVAAVTKEAEALA